MIILTGGAGFIGSCLLRKFNDEGISDIIVVDRLGQSGKWRNLLGKKFAQYIHKSDFREKLKNNEFSNIDSIIHLGACSSTTELNADYLFDNNLNYSIELAEYAAENNIQFIYASSAATYGDGSNGYDDKKFDNLKPMNCYGLTKHLFDEWVIQRRLDKKFTGLKLFNVFGPNEYHKGKMSSMVFKSHKQIQETGKVRLFKSNSPDYSDGGQRRDFIYVKDAVEVIWKIFNKKDYSGIYNLGTGKSHTWNELVDSVFKALEMKPKVEYFDMPEELQEQYQNYTEANMDKFQNSSLNHKFTSLDDSVKDYIINHLKKDNKIY